MIKYTTYPIMYDRSMPSGDMVEYTCMITWVMRQRECQRNLSRRFRFFSPNVWLQSWIKFAYNGHTWTLTLKVCDISEYVTINL